VFGVGLAASICRLCRPDTDASDEAVAAALDRLDVARGAQSAASPSACRSSRTHTFRTPSLTVMFRPHCLQQLAGLDQDAGVLDQIL
jgi:hypothetical protein